MRTLPCSLTSRSILGVFACVYVCACNGDWGDKFFLFIWIDHEPFQHPEQPNNPKRCVEEEGKGEETLMLDGASFLEKNEKPMLSTREDGG